MDNRQHIGRIRRIWAWIDFWSRLEPADLVDDAEKERIRAALRSMRPETRQFLTDVWIRQNEQLARDLESARSRGTSLLAATGVITGVLTLLVPIGALVHSTFRPSSRLATGLLILVGAAFVAMIYFALGSIVLAIRAQEVDFWGQSELLPGMGRSNLAYELEYAFSQYVTYTDNVGRLRNPVGYLRQAQVYFRLFVFALAGLVVASVLAGAAGALTLTTSSAQNSCAVAGQSAIASSSPRCP